MVTPTYPPQATCGWFLWPLRSAQRYMRQDCMHLPPHPALPPSSDLQASKQVPPRARAQHPRHLCLMACLMLSRSGSSEQTEVLTLLGAPGAPGHSSSSALPAAASPGVQPERRGGPGSYPAPGTPLFLLAGSCPDARTLRPGVEAAVLWGRGMAVWPQRVGGRGETQREKHGCNKGPLIGCLQHVLQPGYTALTGIEPRTL